MDGWFLETSQQAPAAPAPVTSTRFKAAELLALVERSIGVFERLGGLDQRDELLVKDILRRNLLTAATSALHRSTAFQ